MGRWREWVNSDFSIPVPPTIGARRLEKGNARRTQHHSSLTRGFLAKQNDSKDGLKSEAGLPRNIRSLRQPGFLKLHGRDP